MKRGPQINCIQLCARHSWTRAGNDHALSFSDRPATYDIRRVFSASSSAGNGTCRLFQIVHARHSSKIECAVCIQTSVDKLECSKMVVMCSAQTIMLKSKLKCEITRTECSAFFNPMSSKVGPVQHSAVEPLLNSAVEAVLLPPHVCWCNTPGIVCIHMRPQLQLSCSALR